MVDLGTINIEIEVVSDEAKDELNNFAGEADKAQSKIGGKFDKLGKKIGKAMAKAAAAAAAAMAAMVVKIGKDAIDAYSEFEQLAGGIELSLGDAYDFIMEKAQEAYKTSGMSMNEYLDQVSTLAVGLRESLGGNEQAAAELADKIINAEADIVAATGSTQDAVQNAFNGIMRGNFTMVDNLRLGITPTREGYQQMIDKVNEWNAAQGNATNYQMDNYADMYNALVNYVDMMGMSGHAAEESQNTIQGAINSTKAAWENFLTALADPEADLDQVTDDLVEAAWNAYEVLGPVVKKIAERIVNDIADKIKEKVKEKLEPIFGDSIDSEKIGEDLGKKLINALTTAISSATKALSSEDGKDLEESVATFLFGIFWGAVKSMPSLAGALNQYVVSQISIAFGLACKAVNRAMVKMSEMVKQAWETIKKKLSEKLKVVIDSKPIQTLIGWVKTAISWWNTLKEKLSHPISALIHTKRTGGGGDNVNGNYPGKRIGLKEVPYDNYKASLHKGEAVLTAAETNIWKKFIGGGLKTDDEPRTIIQETSPATTYNFGNITVDVSSLKDLTTVEDFVEMMTRAKQFA